jgi:hypothetical protein
MCQKLCFFACFVSVLALAGTNVALGGVTWEGRIGTQDDDVEEYVNGGGMYITSSDLEMPYEDAGKGTPQVIGLRFVNVKVPKGANVVNAYVEFAVDEIRDGTLAVSLLIDGERNPNAAPFTSANNNVTGRPRTTAKVVWAPVNWTTVGQKDKTSNIAAVINEVVNQSGWVSGNALVLIFADNPASPSAGSRCADSYSDAATAPLLHVEFSSKFATDPNPADGAVYSDTWVSASWSAGETAVSHDVYFSDNFDDVNDGTAAAFRGNQTGTFFIAGFPGFPYPDGLVPGTTYYWRIDEVEANGTTKYKGPVWSFWIPSRTAYNPNPADGAKFVALDTTLSWTAGFGAKLHTVYFGDSADTVANAAGGLPQGTTSYKPAAALEAAKTYYWRVDEFDALATHKGDVWSFTTAKTTGGVKGQYYRGMAFDTLVLTRTDPQINFNWGTSAPDPVVGADTFSVRWTGEVEAAFTETYTFYPRADDGVRLWVDGKQLVNGWVDQGATEYAGTIDLVAGNAYSIRMEMYENGGDAVAELRWSSPSTPKQLIPQAALSLPLRANSPSPANGIVGARLSSTLLTWNAGDLAASHEVYFGTDPDAVTNATKASPEYKGSKTLGNESYDPGKLTWDTTYYWRVDEVNTDGTTSKGSLWSFSTGAFLLVDDFETYNDIDPPAATSNRIFDKWIDGFATPTTNGALVGNNLPPYAEQAVVHGGSQSMPYSYDNNLKTSEATLTLVYPRNWTEEGVTKLSLWFRGDPANAAERMYVALNGNAVVYHADPKAAQIATWTEWVIDLKAFADQGVVLTNVNTITLGFGTKNSPVAGGSGKMYFDDIRLYRPSAAP